MGYFETEIPGFPKRPNHNWTDYWKEQAERQYREIDPEYAKARDNLAETKRLWNERWPQTLADAHALCDIAAELARKAGEPDQRFRGIKGQIKNNEYYVDNIEYLVEEIDRLEKKV